MNLLPLPASQYFAQQNIFFGTKKFKELPALTANALKTLPADTAIIVNKGEVRRRLVGQARKTKDGYLERESVQADRYTSPRTITTKPGASCHISRFRIEKKGK